MARMHELGLRALASGGHGGHRIMILLLVVLIVAALIAGWIIFARRNRGRS
jgi:hypothetical protein